MIKAMRAVVVVGEARTNPDVLHYAVDRLLPYPCAPLFAIAADVGRYPEFLPGWVAVRTKSLTEHDYRTDQLLAFGPIRERFDSETHLEPPHLIKVVSDELQLSATSRSTGASTR